MLVPLHPMIARRKALRARERSHAAALLRQLRLHHRDTAAHSLRVARLAAWIGGEALYLPALMHDVGKLMVPARLLAAPRCSTRSRWASTRRRWCCRTPQSGTPG